MDHTEGTFRGFEGLELYYQRWRPAKGAKAVLSIVHGFGEHSGRYGNVVDWFVPKGYAVYAFDLRGHGRSPGPRGHVNGWGEFHKDVKLFLEFVRGREPDEAVFLLGHSVGGLIVLEYALHQPEGLAGVIASGPVLAQVGISPFLIALSKILSSILPRIAINTGLDATAISRPRSGRCRGLRQRSAGARPGHTSSEHRDCQNRRVDARARCRDAYAVLDRARRGR